MDKRNYTQTILRSNKHARQRAIAMFPIRIFSMAKDMKRILDLQDDGLDSIELQNLLDVFESKIRDEYRTMFGSELGDSFLLDIIIDNAKWTGFVTDNAGFNTNSWDLPNCDGRDGSLLEAAIKHNSPKTNDYETAINPWWEREDTIA